MIAPKKGRQTAYTKLLFRVLNVKLVKMIVQLFKPRLDPVELERQGKERKQYGYQNLFGVKGT